jgi:phospholipid-binding lipoprotein MlaA
MPRRGAVLIVLSASLLVGCATPRRPDPLEPVNRKVFAFNEAVDDAVLKPVATVYRDTLPAPLRAGVGNFFGNIRDLWSAVNLTLQGRPIDGARDVARFGANTVFGVFGFFDVATGLGLERHREDFGQTLGRWGFGPGAYIVWPILGPSSVRDSVGLPIELQVAPQTWISTDSLRYSLTATSVISTRAGLLDATRLLDDLALDKYVSVRNAYLQRRRNLVYNGDPPIEDEPVYDEPPLDPPAAPADAVDAAPPPASAAASGR